MSSLVDRSRIRLPAGARRDLRTSVALGVGGVLLAVAQAWWLATAVDRAFLGGEPLAGVAHALAALLVLAVSRACCVWGADVAAQRAASRAKLAARREATAAVIARGPVGLASERTGELVGTLGAGVDAIDGYVAQYLPQTRLAVAAPAIVLAAVLWADPLSALVLAVTFPLIPLFMYLIGAAARERTRRQWVTLSRLSARFLDALLGLSTLKAFGRTGDEAERLAAGAERFRAITTDTLRLAFVSSLVLELLATLSTAIVAVEVGLRLLYERMAFHEAIFVLILAPEFYRPLRALGSAYHAGMAGREAAARLADLVDQADTNRLGQARPAPPGTEAAPRAAGRLPGRRGPFEVTFDEVRFAYSEARGPVLRGVSFELVPGTTVALVGPSGSGKSTCANLLLRFAEPSSGHIRIDGIPLAAVPMAWWRERVAWVPQRPHLFHATVRENLTLGRPDSTDRELWSALEAAAARTFVEALPQGLDTPIGERAARLSGGQAQRLAIARALVADAPLVVLDEPTSQVDPWTEPEISAAVERLREGRSVLLIAHRFSMVRRADHAVMLVDGRVGAQGPPASLLGSHEVFRRLAGAAGRDTP